MLTVEAVDLYYGASHALRRVSLVARKGEITCILGRNGVGKTSLLRAIFGLNPISSGRIRWEDQEITRLPPHERARAGLALVPQGRDIFPRLTVQENLETGFAPLPAARRQIPAELFQLFPVLATMLKRRGGDLSGGQQQQLAIARALVTQPRLLILDEPTEGIQPTIVAEIELTIMQLAEEGINVLLVEQHIGFALEAAEHYVVLASGHVTQTGEGGKEATSTVRAAMAI